MRVVDAAGVPSVEILSGDTVLLMSPPEGLWSIATDWRDGWPTEWRHVQPERVSTDGPWTILEGKLESDAGAWRIRGAYRPRGQTVECIRRWEWHGQSAAEKTTLAIRWQAPHAKGPVLLPGILYHGNPSGAASQRTPVFVIGWCGQAAAPGYALQVLADELGDPAIPGTVQKSLDFLSTAEFYDGGFHTWYDYDQRTWSHHEPLSQGQGMLNVARAIDVGRRSGRDTSRWETFLNKAAGFHSIRILQETWRPRSTDEGFFIAPLCTAGSTTSSPCAADTWRIGPSSG